MSRSDSAIFLSDWKDQMIEMVKLKYPKISEDKLEKLLDSQIEKKMNNRTCFLVNNYTERVMETNILDIFDLVKKNNLIMGGAGTLYIQHSAMRNLITEYIADVMVERKEAKNTRDSFDFDSAEYKYYDRVQGNKKTKINSLYGAFGYARFIFHNIFVAESVTSMGKNMITTATLAFEYFLSSNVLCVSPSEVFRYITNIANEWEDNYTHLDDSFIPEVSNEDLLKRLLTFCKFKYGQSFVDHLKGVIVNMHPSIKKMVYYKNNLYEFCSIPLIRLKLKHIVSNLRDFKKPDLRTISKQEIIDEINDVWKYLEYGVLYKYPVFDRVRKGSYSNRHSALYTDTDSNMVSVAKWIRFVKSEVLENDLSDFDIEDLEFTLVNLMAVYLTRLNDAVLMEMGKGMNIDEEHCRLFNMKNEFYFRRMLFTSAKKRYLALKVLKEGKLLGNGAGKEEIKGFDFIKVNTKETLKKFYTDLSIDSILRSPMINKPQVLQQVFNKKREIRRSIDSGETLYFKQANVGIIEQYKNPYSIQGIKGVTLWNALFPDNQLQLPIDVDIVPIRLENPNTYRSSGSGDNIIIERKELKPTSFTAQFANRHPDVFAKLEQNIFNNPNETIRLMGVNVLAKPKNANVKLPDWYYELIDKDKIVDDAMSLINPVMDSLAYVILPTTSTTQHLTNIVRM